MKLYLSRYITLIALVAATTGCASGRSGSSRPATNAPTGVDSGEQLLERIGSLPQQELIPGKCTMFLWTRVGGSRKLVIHQRADEQAFKMRVDGRVVTVPRTAGSGQSIYGIFTDQVAQGAGIRVRLSIVPEQVLPVQQGAQITQASIRITDDNGWNITMPTAGLVACQSNKEQDKG